MNDLPIGVVTFRATKDHRYFVGNREIKNVVSYEIDSFEGRTPTLKIVYLQNRERKIAFWQISEAVIEGDM